MKPVWDFLSILPLSPEPLSNYLVLTIVFTLGPDFQTFKYRF